MKEKREEIRLYSDTLRLKRRRTLLEIRITKVVKPKTF